MNNYNINCFFFVFPLKHTKQTFCRHLRSSASYFTTPCLSASSPSATGVYFTPSGARARWSLVTWATTLPWQRRHVIRTQDRSSSRRLAPCCLARRWTFSRRWSLSSSASCCSGAFLLLQTYWQLSGFVCRTAWCTVLRTRHTRFTNRQAGQLLNGLLILRGKLA